MSKFFIRIAALLLIPCLTVDPVLASSSSFLTTGDGVRSEAADVQLFAQESLIARLLLSPHRIEKTEAPLREDLQTVYKFGPYHPMLWEVLLGRRSVVEAAGRPASPGAWVFSLTRSVGDKVRRLSNKLSQGGTADPRRGGINPKQPFNLYGVAQTPQAIAEAKDRYRQAYDQFAEGLDLLVWPAGMEKPLILGVAGGVARGDAYWGLFPSRVDFDFADRVVLTERTDRWGPSDLDIVLSYSSEEVSRVLEPLRRRIFDDLKVYIHAYDVSHHAKTSGPLITIDQALPKTTYVHMNKVQELAPLQGRVGITGATGAVGHQFIKALQESLGQEAPIHALVLEEDPHVDRIAGTQRIPGDLLHVDALKRLAQESDVIFHLAGWAFIQLPEGKGEADVLLVNSLGSCLVAQVAGHYGRRLVMTSTDFVYALDQRPLGEDPLDEYLVVSPEVSAWLSTAEQSFDHYGSLMLENQNTGSPLEFIQGFLADHPLPPEIHSGQPKIYALSKLLAERLILKSHARAIILRPSHIYGPGDEKMVRGVDRVLHSQMDKKPPTPEIEEGMMYATYIGDAVKIFIAAAAQVPDQPTVVTVTGPSFQRSELYQAAQAAAGISTEVRMRPSQSPSRRYDLRRMQRILGIYPEDLTPLVEGIRQTITWYKNRTVSTSPAAPAKGGTAGGGNLGDKALSLAIAVLGLMAWYLDRAHGIGGVTADITGGMAEFAAGLAMGLGVMAFQSSQIRLAATARKSSQRPLLVAG